MSFRYDVFVSYRWVEPDQTWVRDELVPALQAAGLKVCLDVEDFVPGRDLILEMTRAGAESRRALCILSPEYFEGNRMVGFESLMARRIDPSGTDSRLIPFVLRKSALPDWIRGLIPIDWTKPHNHKREWKKLLQVLDSKKLNGKKPSPVVDANEIHKDTLVLASWHEAYEQTKKDKKYTVITLWLEDKERYLIVDKEHYTNVKPLLDDIYMRFLHDHVTPYSYGSNWVLKGSSLIVPFKWLSRPGTPIQDVDLDWIDCSMEDFWLFNYELGLYTNSAVQGLINDGVYGVLVNDCSLANMVNSHPKSARCLLEHKHLFCRTSFKESILQKYRFQFVYSIPAHRDLGGVVFVETSKVARNPKIIDPIWKIACRLA